MTTPIVVPPGYFSQAVANQNAARQVNCDLLNDTLKKVYANRVNSYNDNMASGETVPPERQHAPVPPASWVLGLPDANGFQDEVQTGPPVAPQAPDAVYHGGIPQLTIANAPPNVIHISPTPQTPGSKWYSALPGDTFPNGKTTPIQPDGHEYEKFGAPVGWGWYLQTS